MLKSQLSRSFLACAIVSGSLLATPAFAVYDTAVPTIPDPAAVGSSSATYLVPGGGKYTISSFFDVFTDISYSINPSDGTTHVFGPAPVTRSNGIVSDFPARSFFDVFVDINMSYTDNVGHPSLIKQLTDNQARLTVMGTAGGGGVINTEMTALNLTGTDPVGPSGPIMLRESPSKASLGRTSITDAGGGTYHIDSFFDVFTELSIDGGNTWIPSTTPDGSAPAALHLTGVPEPTTAALLGVASTLLLGRRRRA